MMQEFLEERQVGLLTPKGNFDTQTLMVMGPLSPGLNIIRKRLYGVTTRGGKSTDPEGEGPKTSVFLSPPKGVQFSDSSPALVLDPVVVAPENYQFDPKVRLEVLQMFAIEKCSVDLFADEVNALELDFITPKENAFTFHWGKLSKDFPCWANPPFLCYLTLSLR